MVDTAAVIWSDYVTIGNPGSGKKKPPKNKIREWGTDVETKVSAALAVGAFGGAMLTLTSGTPVTEADVVGATIVYVTPAFNDRVEIYNGTIWGVYSFTETSVVLNSTFYGAFTCFDVYQFIDAGVVKAGTFGWLTSTDRGTGSGSTEVELYQGRIVNKNAIALRNNLTTYNVPARQATLVGGFRTTLAGQTEDSKTKRLVSNLNNIAERHLIRNEASVTWDYSQAIWRLANNSGFNLVSYFHCVAGRRVDAEAYSICGSSDSSVYLIGAGIGVDSYTVDSAIIRQVSVTQVGNPACSMARWIGSPGIGYHEIAWLEIGAGVGGDTQTWYGTNGHIKSGIVAKLFN